MQEAPDGWMVAAGSAGADDNNGGKVPSTRRCQFNPSLTMYTTEGKARQVNSLDLDRDREPGWGR